MIEWEELTDAEKQAVKLISEKSFMGFQRCWFNILTGEKWGVNWHHKYIAHVIEEIIDGKRGSTIFNIPPGAGKTEMLSIHAPVYQMLKCDKVRNFNVSFSDSLAKRNSKRSKDIISSQEFQELWPHALGTNQADEWQLLNEKGKVKAEIVSRSIGGQITGGRGGYMMDGFTGWIMLDDIDKPGDMFSDVKRKRVHEKLVDTLSSRQGNKSKENPTPFISVQQRLHVDDSTAFLTDPERGIGIDFDVIKIPALINQEYIDSLPEWIRQDCIDDVCGSEQINGYWSFWPKNQDIGFLMRLWERNEYVFMAQYMQSPIALSGNIFKSDWFQTYYDDIDINKEDQHNYIMRPEFMDYRFITADTAQKTKEHNDYSVICEWGFRDGYLYLLDMTRGKWEAPELRKMFTSVVNDAWSRNNNFNGNLQAILVEDKASGTGLVQEMKGLLPLPVTAVQRNTDKVTRANDAAPQIQLGKVRIPANRPWVTEFVSEHSLFTANDSHAHDDIVDNTCDAIAHALLKGSSSIDDFVFSER